MNDLQSNFRRQERDARSALKQTGLFTAGFAAAAVVIILFANPTSRVAYDQNEYHLVAIRTFARQWPRFDFSDYRSATTPGYHLLLSAVSRFLSDELRTLRFFGLFFSIGMIGTFTWVVTRSGGRYAWLLCLPLAGSPYVIESAGWLLPDNAGWWAAFSVLLLALRSRFDLWSLATIGVALFLLVWFRQSHAWVMLPLIISAWIGEPENRRGRVCGTVLAATPAVLVLAYFAWVWRGMVPPQFRAGGGQWVLTGGNGAIPAVILSLVGLMSPFFFGWLLEGLRRAPSRTTVTWIAAGLMVGALAGLLPLTDYSRADGRWSGLWNIVRRLPTVGQRSPLVVGLALLGGGFLGAWLAIASPRDRWILAAAWLGFMAAQTASAFAFHRYYEPFVLLILPLMSVRAIKTTPVQKWWRAGPVVLAIGVAALTLSNLV